jgi:large conductance mechanosensitive channel
MSILGEFKAFIMKGNVVDLAVGVVIGASFKSVVDSVVGDLITPLIALITHPGTAEGAKAGPPDFADWAIYGVRFGSFINVVISFLILAAVVFFLVVKPMNHLKERMTKKAEKEPEAAPLPEDVKLLMEIRDLLKAGRKPEPPAAP